MASTQVDGFSLKVERLRRDVSTLEQAGQMGITKQRLWQIEHARHLTDRVRDRYWDALLICARVNDGRDDPEANTLALVGKEEGASHADS
jgi:hypothetical protein